MKKTVSWVLLTSILLDICLPLFAFSAEPAMTETSSSISVLCNVSGAVIYLDGEKTDVLTPLAEPIMTVPGFHKIRIEKKGYTVWRKEFLLTAGENYTVNAVMVPIDISEGEEKLTEGEAAATLIITSFIEGASIFIDGKEQASLTPLSEPIITEAGFHKLLIRKEGFIPWRKDVMLMAGETMKIEAILLPFEVTEGQEEAFEKMDRKPVTRRWWFWVIVVGAIGAAIASEDANDSSGSVLVSW